MGQPPRISHGMKRDALQSCSLFQVMRSEELDEIVTQSHVRRFARNTVIFHRGDPGTSLMAVLAGSVDIRLTAIDGNKEISYRRVYPREFFGEIALLDGKPRTADAVAVDDTTLVVVERRVFMPILLRHEGLVERMFGVLCSRLRSTSLALEEVALYRVPTRLARMICRMATEYGRPRPDGSVLIDFKMSDDDWSSVLGAPARETVNRIVNEWKGANLLMREGGHIVVSDLGALREIAQVGGRELPGSRAARNARPRTRPAGDAATDGDAV